MALTFGRYNTRSDWLRVRSEWSLCSRKVYEPITDYANYENPGHKILNKYHLVCGGSGRSIGLSYQNDKIKAVFFAACKNKDNAKSCFGLV